MKHDIKITLILLLFFVVAQIVGLALINHDLITEKDGVKTVGYDETVLGEIPVMSGQGVLIYVVIGVAIGTLLLLLIIRLKKIKLWKAWFFLAVFVAISLALGVFLKPYLALIIALILASLKIFKPNVFVHNITEVLMYAGIAFFIVGLFKDEILWISILLILISIYDFIAVYKSKHMVKMAQFQAKSQLFAGLFVPYIPKTQSLGSKIRKLVKPVKSLKSEKKLKVLKQKTEKKNAILGGGDVAFPLIFSGVVMHELAKKFVDSGVIVEVAKSMAFYQSLIITATTTIALAMLFIFAKKDKFYPAMPIITAGCFVGYAIVLLL